MQKGGGCENCGTQYRLPDITLGAPMPNLFISFNTFSSNAAISGSIFLSPIFLKSCSFARICDNDKAGGEEKVYIDAIGEAVKVATAKQYLRPNAVDPVTGKNSGNNTDGLILVVAILSLSNNVFAATITKEKLQDNFPSFNTIGEIPDI